MTLYLSTAQYIERFGNRETITLTAEEPGAVLPDMTKVERAIDDVEELADGYIRSGGYSVPLASAPRAIVGMVADLARERLHKDRPTPEVTAAADRARSQLKDIAAGRLTLLLDEGEAETTGDNLSASSEDAPPVTFQRETLDRFTTLGRGGYADSCWKR